MTDDTAFIEEMARALRERRAEILRANREKIADLTAEEAEAGGDSIDHTTSEQRRDAELRLHGRLAAALSEIEAAERRIDDGEYGECTRCGEEIARGRLRARPEAALCVECQEEAEEEERRRYKRPGLLDD